MYMCRVRCAQIKEALDASRTNSEHHAEIIKNLNSETTQVILVIPNLRISDARKKILASALTIYI